MKLSLGIAGAGIFSRSTHRPVILRHPNLELTGLYSRTPESMAAFCSELPQTLQKTLLRYFEFQDFCNSPTFEAIDLVLPIPAMGEHVRLALGCGKHILSEKPVAGSSREAKALLAIWRNTRPNRAWLVSENWRLLESILAARELLDAGRIGKLVGAVASCTVARSSDSPYERCEWRRQIKPQWGWLTDIGVHVIAGLRSLFGDIRKVDSAMGTTENSPERIAEVVHADLTLTGDMPATVKLEYFVKTGGENRFAVEYRIQGTHGRLMVDRESLRISDAAGNPTVNDRFSPFSFDRVMDVFIQTIASRDFDNLQNPLHPESALADLLAIELIQELLRHEK